MSADVWRERAEIFKESYGEVLAATKHQDDKLARSLTAIAFLTAAGISIYNAVRTNDAVLLDGRPLSAQSFFFIVFLVSAVFAVSASLAAIGPTSHYGESGSGDKASVSLLFFARIAKDDKWTTYIDWTPDELRHTLAKNFHEEAHLIASRVPYKMARSREAAAFINIAAIALALLGVFSIEAISEDTRWWIAASMLFVFCAVPAFDYFQLRLFRWTEAGPVPGSYALLGVSCLAAGLLLALGLWQRFQWPAVGYALGVILTSRLSLLGKSYRRYLLPLSATSGWVILVVLLFKRV